MAVDSTYGRFRLVVLTQIVAFAFVSIFLMMPKEVLSQCTDVFFHQQLRMSNFKDPSLLLGKPLIGDDKSVLYPHLFAVFKNNNTKKKEWAKQIQHFRPQFVREDGTIIGSFNTDIAGEGSGQGGGIAAISEMGDIAWVRKIDGQNYPAKSSAFLYSHVYPGIDDDLILCTNGGVNGTDIVITVLNSLATTVKSSQIIRVNLPDLERVAGARVAVIGNSIYLTCIINYTFFDRFESKLLLMKLDYVSLDITKISYQQSDDEIRSPRPFLPPIIHRGILQHNSYLKATIDAHLVLAGQISPISQNRHFAIRMDTNLTVTRHAIFNTPEEYRYHSNHSPQVDPFINNYGHIMFAGTRDSANTLTTTAGVDYFITDENLNVIAQRYIPVSESSLQPGRVHGIPVLMDNKDAQVIFQRLGSTIDSALSILNIPWQYQDVACSGKETDYIRTETPVFNALTVPFIEKLPGYPLALTPFQGLTSVDVDAIEETFCEQKSVCDDIQLIAVSDFCQPGDTADFRILKNEDCFRRIKWTIDTSALLTLTSDDALLRVKFKKAFSGFITATYEDCTISDSIYIQVFPSLPLPDLGNDTTLCTDSSLIIYAGKGYSEYQWNDGSTSDSLLISRPGTYHVTVKDFCNNTFADTITIERLANKLSLVYEPEICKQDTATIMLDKTFKNYKWTGEQIIRTTDNLLFFPEKSTTMTITAEVFPGCRIAENLFVNVVECPEKVYFPNAFSPNNDGINDTFKPAIEGRITDYRLSIYNRYGQLIYRTTYAHEGWDGRFKGVDQPNGAYVWTCEYAFRKKTKTVLKGTVILLK